VRRAFSPHFSYDIDGLSRQARDRRKENSQKPVVQTDYFTTLCKTDEHGFCMFLIERWAQQTNLHQPLHIIHTIVSTTIQTGCSQCQDSLLTWVLT
jgi:hypothetical protein